MTRRRLRALLWPHLTNCSGCGKTLREWRRHPCTRCGDTRRTVTRSFTEAIESKDTMQ